MNSSAYLSLFVSSCFFLSLFFSLSLPVSFCFFVTICMSASSCFFLSLFVSICLSLFPFVSVPHPVSFCLFASLCLFLFPFAFLYSSVSLCLFYLSALCPFLYDCGFIGLCLQYIWRVYIALALNKWAVTITHWESTVSKKEVRRWLRLESALQDRVS